MNFSFAGCGFLGIYHVGVAACLKKYAPDLLVNKISGASAGALAAVCLLCDSPLGDITSSVLKTALEARKMTLGPFSPTFDVEKLLREGLLAILPENAHKIVSGRLFISVTRVSDGKNVLLSQFDTREELVQALLCTAFIPSFSGWVCPRVRGVRYIDGGFTDNLPQLDDSTVTVSPFCGECDIGPKDPNAGLITISLANTSIELSRENLYRFSGILFPPPPKILNKMCQQGFSDALEFLQRSSLISCTTCLSLEANIPDDELESDAAVVRKRSVRRQRKKTVGNYDYETEEEPCESDCKLCVQQQQDAILDTLPESVGSILQESIDKANKGLMNWVFKHKSMKLITIVTLPYVVPMEIAYAAAVKFINSVPSPSDVNRLAKQLISLLQALFRSWLRTSAPERHTGHRVQKEDANFSCQLAITEIGGDDILAGGNKQGIPFNLSFDTSANSVDLTELETESLHQMANRCGLKVNSRDPSRRQSLACSRVQSRIQSRAASRVQSRAPSRVHSRAVSRRASINFEDEQMNYDCFDGAESVTGEDTLERLIVAASQQEAVMAYYYKDEDNDELQMTEIFDITEDNFSKEYNYEDTQDEMNLDPRGEEHLRSELQSRLQSVRDTIQFKLDPPSPDSPSQHDSFSEPEVDQQGPYLTVPR